MNRKDIILVAVLINMGLLVVLFTSALKPNAHLDDGKKTLVKSESAPHEEVAVNKSDDSLDQVDKILTQFVQQETKPAIETPNIEKKEEASTPVVLEEQYKEVIVMQGDFLEKIARRYQTSVEEIMRINQMKNTKLKIGQILYVPNKPAKTDIDTRVVKATPKREIQPDYYIMKKGDNPWSVAIKNHLKLEELLRLNDLDERKAKKLKPGDKLRIR